MSAGIAMSNTGVLTITGTGHADSVLVEPSTISQTQTRLTSTGDPIKITTKTSVTHVKVTDLSDPAAQPVEAYLAVDFRNPIREIDVNAGDGDDVVDTTRMTQRAVVDLGAGNDTDDTGAGDDVVHGRAGDDRIGGGKGKDNLFGDEGADVLASVAGNDALSGLAGEDVLSGGAGNDQLTVVFNMATYVANHGRSVIPTDEFTRTGNGTDTVDVKVNLGQFVNDQVLPVVQKIQGVTRYLTPLTDLYFAEVPAVRDIAHVLGIDNKPGMKQMLEHLRLGDLLDHDGRFSSLVGVVHDVNNLNITRQDATHMVDVGHFEVSASTGRGTPHAVIRRVETSNPLLSVDRIDRALTRAGISFPVLHDPNTWGELALGRAVGLMSFTLPTLDFEKTSPHLNLPVPLQLSGMPLPITLNFGLDFGLKLHFAGAIGLDTTGIQTGNLLDGFYVDDKTGGSIEFDVNPSVGTAALGFDAKLLGTIGGKLGVTLHDPNGDGRVHVAEMATNGTPFTLSPSIPWSLSLQVKTPIGKPMTVLLKEGEIDLGGNDGA